MTENQDCPIEIACKNVHELLQSAEPISFIDCREPEEFDIARIEGATLIPMSHLADRLEEVQSLPDQTTVIFCHHGGRSLQVAQWMRQQGIARAQSMVGGIDLWAQTIDTSIPRY